MSDSIKVMTITVSKSIALPFESLMKRLNLRRDSYLSSQLENEIDLLEQVPKLKEATRTYFRLVAQRGNVDKVKMGMKLSEELIVKINKVCKEKGIPRDLFIERFLNFLANGYSTGKPFEDIPSPLGKAAEYLEDPYKDTVNELNIYKQHFSLPDGLEGLFPDDQDIASVEN